jgi:hypothetical protein
MYTVPGIYHSPVYGIVYVKSDHYYRLPSPIGIVYGHTSIFAKWIKLIEPLDKFPTISTHPELFI